MPKTKFQGIVFTLMSAFVMVYLMIAYNISFALGGLKNSVFLISLKSMWVIYLIAILAAFFIAKPLALKLTFKIFSRGDKPILITLAVQSFTVCFMVVIMAFAATVLRKGIGPDFVSQYLTSVFNNFSFAYFLQIFAAGPLVRLIFRGIFKDRSQDQSKTQSCL